jgi:hypothetical protein
MGKTKEKRGRKKKGVQHVVEKILKQTKPGKGVGRERERERQREC